MTRDWFPPDPVAAAARNAARDGRSRVPDVGFYATLGRLRRPRLADGFDRLFAVSFDGSGGFRIEQMATAGTRLLAPTRATIVPGNPRRRYDR